MTNATISIVGCGWLGLALAKELIANNYNVRGSSTTIEQLPILLEAGIDAHQLLLSPQLESSNAKRLLDCDILLINVPPGRKRNDAQFHIQQIQALLAELPKKNLPKILFISSTSVYANDVGMVTEQSPLSANTQSGIALSFIERELLPDYAGSWSVLRLSGLIGPQRKPGRFFATRALKDPDAVVNLIHRDDCIGIILALIERDVWGESWNACSDKHPNKLEFYNAAAAAMGIAPPNVDAQLHSNTKIIDNRAIKRALNYQFKYPDPIAWVEDSEKHDA
ncbi:SDR family NAD(P)-dependent oxidoreductase [Alginatibacterium sediminis]|uniref:SDR family NAD(P)-dependent oxidoreductase n=1 Tax=Alginatibacterium sediminis TaxID=2164068 RepID=A0A420E8S0_9ALTE|nr:SDR family NAD(P)-dependent oxidoreductase [Alginatibacterium sediminis]RKF15777.1 SDR family NAD(P)-dependent oxidoreductase [Alginatibacterium sediminis]